MIGSTIYRLAVCASTNDVAKTLAQAGAETGTVVIADEQTSGRGTKGRGWHSAKGRGLYASVILRPQRRDIALLPAAAGLAVSDAIKLAAGLETRLKWPNDVVWHGRKIAGVLSEAAFLGSAASHVVVGIGINVRHSRRDFPAEIAPAATSLRLALRRAPDTAKLEAALWQALDVWFGKFAAGKKRDIIDAFESRLVYPVGSAVTVEREKESVTGTLSGLDAQARLILERGGRILLLTAAEIVTIQPYSLPR
jgi:BirA family biotin operon repressor/biotin-[acetyl-CoA-carboxylase] ligase